MVALRSLFIILAAGVALVAAPAASAATTLSILDLQATVPEGLKEKGSLSLPFKVNLVADGFFCPQPSSFPIALNVTGTIPPGTTVTVDPPAVELSIPAGNYMQTVPGAPAPLSSVYNGSADAALKISVTNVTANATVPVTVVATFDGTVPTGCQSPSGGISAAEGSAKTAFGLIAPPPPVVMEEEPAKSPAPGALVGALAAVGLALVLRRRRA